MPNSLKSSLPELKPYVLVAVIYTLVLATLPRGIKQSLPCLHPNPGDSFLYENCYIALALDRFIIIALIGMATSILAIYLVKKPPLKHVATFALILAAITIAAYYIYIPIAEGHIANAPIRLDPESFDPSQLSQ